jgi:hypothetical protein
MKPDSIEQSEKWRHSSFPHPKQLKTQKSSSKVLASVFLLVDYLEKGRTIMAKYCVALLNKLNRQLVAKHGGKLLKGLLFLQTMLSLQGGHYAPEIDRSSL